MKWSLGRLSDFTPQQLEEVYLSLTPARKAHIDRMAIPAAREQSLAAEALLRRLLQTEFGLASPRLDRRENGRPYVEDGPFVSIAHCDDRVVCAADADPVGIDIERIRPVKSALIDRVCVDEEAEYIRSDSALRDERFCEIWTGKEAYFKKMGTGITRLKDINILTLPRQVFREEDFLIQII